MYVTIVSYYIYVFGYILLSEFKPRFNNVSFSDMTHFDIDIDVQCTPMKLTEGNIYLFTIARIRQ